MERISGVGSARFYEGKKEGEEKEGNEERMQDGKKGNERKRGKEARGIRDEETVRKGRNTTMIDNKTGE